MTAGGRDKKAVLEKEAGAASALNGEFTDAGPRSCRPEPETDLGRDVAASLPATSLHRDGHGSAAGSRNPQVESDAPPPSRSEAVTLVRGSLGFAFADTLAMLEEPTTPAPTEWCVDLGERLITLSTFETWTAIARGEVRAATRAWREGLECWTRVDELPELACALGDLEATAETPATPAPVITDLPTPDSLAAFERETVAEGDEIPPPAMRGGVIPLFAAARRVASPRAIGALVAAAAVLLAATRPGPSAHAAAAAGRAEANRAGLEMIAKRLTVGALESALHATPPSAPSASSTPREALAAAPPSSPRRMDRGQHRLRKSAR